MKPDTAERLRRISGPDLWPEIERRIEDRRPQPIRSVFRYATPIAASLVILTIFGWAFLSLRDGFREGPRRPALTSGAGASVAGLRAHVQVLPDSKVGAALGREGLMSGNPFASIPGGTSVIIRLDWTTQPAAPSGSSYTVVLMNKNDLGPKTAAGPMWAWPPSTTLGWSSSLSAAASRYPWLAPTVDVCSASGCTNWTEGASVLPQSTGPLWIVDRWPARDANGLKAGPTPDPLVGVIFANQGQDQIFWAQRVYG